MTESCEGEISYWPLVVSVPKCLTKMSYAL
jgi:hypothetical protein